jgi:hypothetical protein
MILCMQSGFATDSEISAAAAGWLLDSAILGGKWWGVQGMGAVVALFEYINIAMVENMKKIPFSVGDHVPQSIYGSCVRGGALSLGPCK